MTKRDSKEQQTGPVKGDFIAPSEVEEQDERADSLPQQDEFWRPPVRFCSGWWKKSRWGGIGSGVFASCFHR